MSPLNNLFINSLSNTLLSRGPASSACSKLIAILPDWPKCLVLNLHWEGSALAACAAGLFCRYLPVCPRLYGDASQRAGVSYIRGRRASPPYFTIRFSETHKAPTRYLSFNAVLQHYFWIFGLACVENITDLDVHGNNERECSSCSTI